MGKTQRLFSRGPRGFAAFESKMEKRAGKKKKQREERRQFRILLFGND
jgi:hypothetical protein